MNYNKFKKSPSLLGDYPYPPFIYKEQDFPPLHHSPIWPNYYPQPQQQQQWQFQRQIGFQYKIIHF